MGVDSIVFAIGGSRTGERTVIGSRGDLLPQLSTIRAAELYPTLCIVTPALMGFNLARTVSRQ